MGWAGRVNAWVCGRGQAANSDGVLEVPGEGAERERPPLLGDHATPSLGRLDPSGCNCTWQAVLTL